MSPPQLLWTQQEVFEFLQREFPQALSGGRRYKVSRLEPGRVVIGYVAGDCQLRPGGTVSGPAQMELVDFATYFLLLAHHGENARLAVTTGFNCSFLRKPGAGMLTCHIELLKHGRTLSVAGARIYSGAGKMVLHGEATYFMGGP